MAVVEGKDSRALDEVKGGERVGGGVFILITDSTGSSNATLRGETHDVYGLCSRKNLVETLLR